MNRRPRLWNALTLAALAGGIAVRIYAAWTLKHLPWRDASIPMLMSRHLARGEPMSVFYYGQAYMGSLEAWVSSLIMRVMGPTPFAACLGTVLLSIIALGLTVSMARTIGGTRAGFLTGLLMISCSDASLYLSAHPRGGYMVMLVCGLGVVQLLSRVMRRLEDGTLPRVSWELPLAGLLAGIGWWNLQLVVVFLAAAVVAGIAKAPRLIRRTDVYLAAAAFVLGSSPWWGWNLVHGGESLSMGGAVGAVDLETGISRFARQGLHMMGWKEPVPLRLPRVMAGAGLTFAAVWLLMRQFFRVPTPAHRPLRGLSVHLWVLVATFAIYSLSHFSSFNTPRYLLPLYPSFAILAGVMLDRVCRIRRGWIPALVLLGVLLAQNNWKLHRWNDHLDQDDTIWRRAGQVAEVLNTHADGVALGGPMQHWLTVASNEQAIVVGAPSDVYAPYNRLWATVDRQAVLDPDRTFAGFLDASGGKAERERIGPFHLYHHLVAPTTDIQVLQAEDFESAESSTGPAASLHDRDAGTWITADAAGRLDITWSFVSPQPVSGLILPCLTKQNQARITVWGQTETTDWVLLKQTGPGTPFFWSGNRLIHQGPGYYRQVRWDPPAPLSGLRIRFEDLGQPLREAWLILPGDSVVSTQELSDAPLDTLHGTLVAPRWMVDRIMPRAPEGLDVLAPSFWGRSLNELAMRDPDSFQVLPARDPLWVYSYPGSGVSKVLEGFGVHCEPFMILGQPFIRVTGIESVPGGLLPVAVTEFGLLADSDFRLNRWARAKQVLEEAEALDPGPRQRVWLEEASRLCPESMEVRKRVLAANGTPVDGSAGVRPGRSVDGTFRNGLTLRGIDWEVQGRELRIQWIWEVPAGVDLRKHSLFVHVTREGSILFQDDHNPGHWVEEGLAQAQPLDRVVVINRTLAIPDGVRGPVDLQFGWIDPGSGNRIQIRSGPRVERGKMGVNDLRL